MKVRDTDRTPIIQTEYLNYCNNILVLLRPSFLFGTVVRRKGTRATNLSWEIPQLVTCDNTKYTVI